MPFQVATTAYGRPALAALRDAVAAAKGGDPLAPVTVVVASNHVGVTARRLLAAGALGPVTPGQVGVAAVGFVTAYRLAELLGSAALAAAGRRPVSTPVVAAALRRALDERPGIFAPVAAHPATEQALVAAYTELSDVSEDGWAALAAGGRRPRDVVRICRRARELLAPDWYDEADLTASAIAQVDAGTQAGAGAGAGGLAAELGHVVVHLPQDLLQRQAGLLAALARRVPATVIVGVTGRWGADAGVARSLARLGVEPPPGLATAEAGAAPAATPTPLPPPPPLPVSVESTRIVTASDADDEVRAAVRAVVDAARDGAPLDRIAILFGSAVPYGRLVHEHLAAAGIARNGAAVRPLAASALGRTLLDVLALADHDFRRADVMGLLARAAEGSADAPTAAWERITRQAGVVAGRSDWDNLLDRAAHQSEVQAAKLGDSADDRDLAAARFPRLQAERARRLRELVLALVDGVAAAQARPAPWAERVAWLRALVTLVAGGDVARRAWPADEVRAADKVDAALDRLATLDAVDGPAPLAVFRRTLEVELDADLGRVGRFGEGVLVGPLSFAVGLDLDLVIVVGMAEGTLPAPVHDDALLTDADRGRALGQLDLRRQRVGRDHRRVLAALAAARRQVLCLPRGDLRASSARVPSRWLAEVASQLAGERVPTDAIVGFRAPWLEDVPSFAHAVRHRPFPATGQEYRLRAGARGAPDDRTEQGAAVIRARRSPVFTRFDGNLAGVGVPSPHDSVVSSTRLEGWAKCPFAYFAERLLEVAPVEDPAQQLEMSALVRGSLVHEVLEQFITEVVARPPERQPGPDQLWSADDHALIRRIAQQLCDDYEGRGLTGRPVFWRRDRAQIVALADRFLFDDDAKRRAARSRPLAAEHTFGFGDGAPPVEITLDDGRVLRFRGSADRIDVTDDGGLVVLDYKTGRADDYRRLSAENPDDGGTRLQLVVYAQAARAFAGRPDAPVTSEYWFVSDRGGFSRLGYSVDDKVLAQVTTTLGTIVAGIERGAFPAHPIESFPPYIPCPYCDPDGMGVAELRRGWQAMRDDPGVVAYAELVEPREVAEVAAS
ncbi:MAG TPA: PD-(D/E)XK nuclease family protein [Acidimicrobiales bacterium]|nr:PD-(D/E)XK nuclease family protein [Acidimicrobiales bacterium]